MDVARRVGASPNSSLSIVSPSKIFQQHLVPAVQIASLSSSTWLDGLSRAGLVLQAFTDHVCETRSFSKTVTDREIRGTLKFGCEFSTKMETCDSIKYRGPSYDLLIWPFRLLRGSAGLDSSLSCEREFALIALPEFRFTYRFANFILRLSHHRLFRCDIISSFSRTGVHVVPAERSTSTIGRGSSRSPSPLFFRQRRQRPRDRRPSPASLLHEDG